VLPDSVAAFREGRGRKGKEEEWGGEKRAPWFLLNLDMKS